MDTQKQNTKQQLEETRAKIDLARAEMELKTLTRAQKLSEARDPWDSFDFHSPMLRLADRFSDGQASLFHQFSLASDRRHGDNWPFWRTWAEHSQLRAQARLVTTITTAGTGILEGLCSYVVGDGYQWEAKPKKKNDGLADLAKEINRIFDDFHKATTWNELEQELFKRSREDGEYFLRYFPQDDGITHLRCVEAAEVIEPTSQPRAEWSYGIQTDPEDVEDVKGYFVSYTGEVQDGELVPADEIDHIKVNVPRRVKRGCTDFCWQAEELIRTGGRALENMGEGTAIQAAIAFIRQHDGASQSEVRSFIDRQADYTRPNPYQSSDYSVETYPPGKIIDIPKNMSYVASPFATSVPNFTAAIQSVLQAVAVRWNAPPWIVSGSMDATSFASSLTAENPFVKTSQRAQTFYRVRWEALHWKVLRNYVRSKGGHLQAGGRSYDWQTIRRVIEITGEPPRVAVRNRGEEAQVDQVYLANRVKSPQVVAQEQGVDHEQVVEDWKVVDEVFGQSGQPLDVGFDFQIPGEADEPVGREQGAEPNEGAG